MSSIHIAPEDQYKAMYHGLVDFIDWLVDNKLPEYDLSELYAEHEKYIDGLIDKQEQRP